MTSDDLQAVRALIDKWEARATDGRATLANAANISDNASTLPVGEARQGGEQEVEHANDPRGFRARCIGCRKAFYIPWETMCDAGYCDGCLKAMRHPKTPAEKGE